MKATSKALAVLAVVMLVACGTGGFDPDGPDRDCGDFDNWADANEFYDAAKPGDPHRLDQDKDGVPCESLPGAP